MTSVPDGLAASNLMIDVAGIRDTGVASPESCTRFVEEMLSSLSIAPDSPPALARRDSCLPGWSVTRLLKSGHVAAHFEDRGVAHLDLAACRLDPLAVTEYLTGLWPGSSIRARHAVRPLTRPVADKTKYARLAGRYDDFYSTNLERFEDGELASMMSSRHAPRVLDLGCGTGAGLRLAADVPGLPQLYVGVDHSRSVLDHFWFRNAGSRVSLSGGRFWADGGKTVCLREEPILEALDRIAATDRTFDLVLGLWSLHYLPAGQFDDVLARIRDVIEPGGRLIATIYGPERAHMCGYLCPHDESGITLERTPGITSRLHSAGFRTVGALGMTGPIMRAWRASRGRRRIEKIERRLWGNPFDHSYRCTVLEASA